MLDKTLDTVPRDTDTEHQGRPPPPRKRHRVLGLVLLVVLIGAAALGAKGVLKRQDNDAKLAAWTDAQAIPTVNVVLPAKGAKAQDLILPGDIQAFYEAPIYARVPGYLKMWYQDIGARVKAGQLLGEIDTPDLDQQLAQAKSDLASVEADYQLAVVTAKRWKALVASNSVSQQVTDEKVAAAVAKKALVAGSQANVDRLNALEGFKRLVAPFDGVVTGRETDVGALINVGSADSNAVLFKVADIHEMRVYVRVPQAYSSQLYPGMTADLKLAQYPHDIFKAKLETLSNAITEGSRTVLVELLAKNPEGKLWPGTFAEIYFHLPPDADIYRLPASSMVFRQHGLQVATVGPDNKVLLKPITPGRNLGVELEVLSGLSPSDRVIANPPDSIDTGDEVKVAAPGTGTVRKVASDKPATGSAE